jgi:hypothetical protein
MKKTLLLITLLFATFVLATPLFAGREGGGLTESPTISK